jgi:hypothetical protein
MRSTPYSFAKTPTAVAEPKLNKVSYDSSIVRDLSEEIARPIGKNTSTAAAPQTETTAEPKKETTGPKSTATIDEGVKEMREKVEKQLEETIKDPKRASKNVLRFINMARFVLYPWIYKRIIFEGAELAAFDATIKKQADAGIQGKTIEFNDFEKKLLKKFDDYEILKKAVLWTPDEIDQINEVAYLKLAEIKFLRWLMGNEWALVILYIEGKRFMPVVGSRFGFSAGDFSAL